MNKWIEVDLPTEEEIGKMLRKLSRQWNVRTPGLAFHNNGSGRYQFDSQTIWLPQVEWINTYDPDCTGYESWAVVFHEFAHYLNHLFYDGFGHDASFYSILTAMALQLDLPLDAFYLDEGLYRPRSFKSGRVLAGQSLMSLHQKSAIKNFGKTDHSLAAAKRWKKRFKK